MWLYASMGTLLLVTSIYLGIAMLVVWKFMPSWTLAYIAVGTAWPVLLFFLVIGMDRIAFGE